MSEAKRFKQHYTVKDPVTGWVCLICGLGGHISDIRAQKCNPKPDPTGAATKPTFEAKPDLTGAAAKPTLEAMPDLTGAAAKPTFEAKPPDATGAAAKPMFEAKPPDPTGATAKPTFEAKPPDPTGATTKPVLEAKPDPTGASTKPVFEATQQALQEPKDEETMANALQLEQYLEDLQREESGLMQLLMLQELEAEEAELVKLLMERDALESCASSSGLSEAPVSVARPACSEKVDEARPEMPEPMHGSGATCLLPIMRRFRDRPVYGWR